MSADLVQELWIPGPMPSLNQLIGGKVRDRIRLKQQWIDVVVALAMVRRLRPMGAVRMAYAFFEKKGHPRDPLNILAGAAKIIEDALVQARVLVDDNRSVIRGIELRAIIDRPSKPGVMVELREAV